MATPREQQGYGYKADPPDPRHPRCTPAAHPPPQAHLAGYGAQPGGYPPPAPGYGGQYGGPDGATQFNIGDAFSWSWNNFTQNAVPLIVSFLLYSLVLGVAGVLAGVLPAGLGRQKDHPVQRQPTVTPRRAA